MDRGLEFKPIKLMLHHAAMSFICTCLSPLQPSKARQPIFVTELGIVTDISMLQ